MIKQWLESLEQCDMKEHLMFAFTRQAVLSLNEQAHLALQTNKQISKEEYDYCSEGGTKDIKLSLGERILLRQNDLSLGIRNGDLATITAIDEQSFAAILDTGEKVTIPKDYKHIDYGYALTVHKSQGLTVDKTSILIDSKYWDRNLSFVAMTRHRQTLAIYADKEQHSNIEALTKTLKRESTKDNVIDWPLDYAIRLGFEPDSLIGKAINYLTGYKEKIANKWNYIVHYEDYLKAQEQNINWQERQENRSFAKEFANFHDENIEIYKKIRALEKTASVQNKKAFELPEYEMLYKQRLEQEKKAYDLVQTQQHKLDKIAEKTNIKPINKAAERYQQYLTIKSIAENVKIPASSKTDFSLTIDLKKNYIHIKKIAKGHDLLLSDLYAEVKKYQLKQEKINFEKEKKQHPILAEYEALEEQRRKLTGLRAEILDKKLLNKVKEIISNKSLFQKLQEKLPQLTASLLNRVKAHEHERGKEH